MIWHRRNQADLAAHRTYRLWCRLAMCPGAAGCGHGRADRSFHLHARPIKSAGSSAYSSRAAPPAPSAITATISRRKVSGGRGSPDRSASRAPARWFRISGRLAIPAPAHRRTPRLEPAPAPQSGSTGPAEPATGAGESRPAASGLCYALTYETCGPNGKNCDMKPASICAQPDNRWLMIDGMPGDLDPLTRFLPGDPGKCYRVYREGQPRPLCTEAPGSPNTVWSLR